MIEPIDPYLEAFAHAGADSITVHAEATRHLDRSLQAIRALGKKAGVALNPATPPDAIEFVLDRLDLVLVMTVNPGFGGQAFIPAMVDKVAQVRADDRRPADPYRGRWRRVAETAPLFVAAGANALVAGSAVFAGGGRSAYAAHIAALRRAVAAARPRRLSARRGQRALTPLASVAPAGAECRGERGASHSHYRRRARHRARDGAACRGARLVGRRQLSRDEAAAHELVAEIARGGGKAVALRGDVANEEDVAAMFDGAARALGPLTRRRRQRRRSSPRRRGWST